MDKTISQVRVFTEEEFIHITQPGPDHDDDIILLPEQVELLVKLLRDAREEFQDE